MPYKMATATTVDRKQYDAVFFTCIVGSLSKSLARIKPMNSHFKPTRFDELLKSFITPYKYYDVYDIYC